jgi:hypothetical protein
MRDLSTLARWASLFSALIAFIAPVHAQSDNPLSDLSLDPDEAVNVVYAVYGGISQANAHYVDVTDKVTALLKSPAGFPATEKAVLGVEGTKEFQSLLVVYNYKGKSHLFNMPEGGGTVTLDKLKEETKVSPSRENEIPSPGSPDADFRIDFAAYGVSDGGREPFWTVTDLVQKLMRDQPEGFSAHEADMGGDPHPGDQKAIVIIFDNAGVRHFFAQVNNGPLINKAALLQAAQPN